MTPAEALGVTAPGAVELLVHHNTLLDAALVYSRRHWSVIPIRHKPGTNGKQPAVAWREYQTRRPTESELRDWFGNGRPVDGLAVILGAASGGLVCRDFDTLESYEQWAAAHPDLAESLPTVETARGRHVYFLSEWSGFIDLGDGELRGDPRHYCILPPSRHPSGAIYEWIVPLADGELPFLDPELAGFAGETERTEQTEQTKQTEAVGTGLSADSERDAIEHAIHATLPQRAGQRNRSLFFLARTLKAIPSIADEDAPALRGIVRRWHKLALPVIETKGFDDTWTDFTLAWLRVRFPAGTGPMETALKNADAATLPPAIAEMYDSPVTHRLVKLCRELQRMSRDDPFFLSCRTAGGLLNVDYRTAWQRLGMLERDGVLRVVKRGAQGRATRFRYVHGE